MDALRDYRINFKGLKNGMHHFNFYIGDAFFKHFTKSEITKGEFQASVVLTKKTRFLVLEFDIKGKAMMQCDVCLDDFYLPLSYGNTLYVKFDEEIKEDDEHTDVMYLSPNDSSVDLGHYIYESIILSIPYKRVHPLDDKGKATCDERMLEKINAINGSGKNEEITDPRWSKLKYLLENNN